MRWCMQNYLKNLKRILAAFHLLCFLVLKTYVNIFATFPHQ